jgi:hypothetical protein
MVKRVSASNARELARAASDKNRNSRKIPKSHQDQRNSELPTLEDDEVDIPKGPTEKQQTAIRDIARDQVKLVRSLEKLQEQAKKIALELDRNRLVLLPEAMKKARVDKMELAGGFKIEMTKVVFANVPQPDGKADNAAERHALGIAYLDKVAPDLVTHGVNFKFKRGEQEAMFRKFIADLQKRKEPLDFVIKDSVDPRSLAAWVRKKDEAAEVIEDKTLGVHRFIKAEVKIPKKKGLV